MFGGLLAVFRYRCQMKKSVLFLNEFDLCEQWHFGTKLAILSKANINLFKSQMVGLVQIKRGIAKIRYINADSAWAKHCD